MAQKPRNFAAMREDRLILMARAHFGREFRSKAEAVRALSKLAVKEQHAIPKPRDPEAMRGRLGKPLPGRSRFNNELRGGVATPSSTKLADARPEVVKRYARMTTGLESKSKAQALTLMAKFAPTDVAKAAGGAIGRGGLRKQAGPSKAELVAQYRRAFGVNPSTETKRTKASLAAALQERESSMAKQTRKPSKATTAKAQVAAAYTEAFGRAPSKKMSAKAMTDAVANVKSRIAQQDMMMDRLLVGDKPTGRTKTTAKAQAAAAYKATFKADPPKKMSAKAMRTAVSQEGLRTRHATSKAAVAATQNQMWGGTGQSPMPRTSVPSVPKPAATASKVAAAAPKLTPQMFVKPKGGGRVALAVAAAGAALGAASVLATRAKADSSKPAPAPSPAGGLNAMQTIGAMQAGTGIAMMAAGMSPAARSVGKIMALSGAAVTALGFGQKAASGAYMSDAAKQKAASEPAPAARPAAAPQPDSRGSGPVDVPGYTRADGVQVRGYTRQRTK